MILFLKRISTVGFCKSLRVIIACSKDEYSTIHLTKLFHLIELKKVGCVHEKEAVFKIVAILNDIPNGKRYLMLWNVE